MMCPKKLQSLLRGVSTALLLNLSSLALAIDESIGIDWQPCAETPEAPFECATVYVPLDYQNGGADLSSDGENTQLVSIALARLPASDGKNKKGSLFLNPGGPGGSGVSFVFGVGPSLYTEEVRRQFDLIGFDPRGIARSSQLTCFEDVSEIDPLLKRPAFPISQKEIQQYQEVDQYVSDLCNLRASDLIDYMSTADVARDLDLLRQAVGDEKLNFVGYSYGSYLGVTYANLFPEKVGAMVVDGVLDPVAWATGRGLQSYFLPFSTRIKSSQGTSDSLKEFFRTCDEGGPQVCPLAGNSESRFAMVAQRALDEPIVATLPDGTDVLFDYASLVSFTIGAMYAPSSWPNFAAVIDALESEADASELVDRYQGLLRSLGIEHEETPVPQPLVGGAGVFCSDTDNPPFYESWQWAGEISEAKHMYFGKPWTWISSICHSWPGSKESRFVGKFKARTANPVLIVNTLFDAATPYRGAKIVNGLLPRSRLLTVNGWGHTSLFLSDCATAAVSDYLLNGALPKKGASCDPDSTPFDASLPLSDFAPRSSIFVRAGNAKNKDGQALRRRALKHIRPISFNY